MIKTKITLPDNSNIELEVEESSYWEFRVWEQEIEFCEYILHLSKIPVKSLIHLPNGKIYRVDTLDDPPEFEEVRQ